MAVRLLSAPKFVKPLVAVLTLTHLKNLMRYAMRNKNLYVIIIVLLAVLLMAIVIWLFDIRIENIEKQNKVYLKTG